MRQDALAAGLRARNARVVARAERVRDTAPPDLMRKRPAPGVWSAAEVFEHLCLSDEGYLACMRPLIRAARAAAGDETRTDHRWRGTLMGRLLVWSLTANLKVKTVAKLEPRGGGAGPGADAWLAMRREVDGLLDASATLVWRRLRFVSPVAPVVRPNLGDAFLVLVAHAEHHLDQIEDRTGIGRAGRD